MEQDSIHSNCRGCGSRSQPAERQAGSRHDKVTKTQNQGRAGQIWSCGCLCLWWMEKQAYHPVISDTKYLLVGLKTARTQCGRPGNTKSRHRCFQLRKSPWQGNMDLCRTSPLKAHRQRARPRVARKKVGWWYIPGITVLGREGEKRKGESSKCKSSLEYLTGSKPA